MSQYETVDTLVERRSAPRQIVSLPATLKLSEDGSPIACTVRDISEGGARLKLESEIVLPQRFQIAIAPHNEVYRALLCWSKGDELGVAFEYDDDDQF